MRYSGIKEIYVEKSFVGWRVVAEASPSRTGLPLWVRVRRWRLTHKTAVRVARDLEPILDDTIQHWRAKLVREEQDRQRETIVRD